MQTLSLKSHGSAVPPVDTTAFLVSMRVVAGLDDAVSRDVRRKAIAQHLSRGTTAHLEDLVRAIDARLDAYCRLTQYDMFHAWAAAEATFFDLWQVASYAPVTRSANEYFEFHPDIFFALLLSRVHPAGSA